MTPDKFYLGIFVGLILGYLIALIQLDLMYRKATKRIIEEIHKQYNQRSSNDIREKECGSSCVEE